MTASKSQKKDEAKLAQSEKRRKRAASIMMSDDESDKEGEEDCQYMYEKKVKIGGEFKWVIVDTSDPKVRSEWEKLPWGNAKGRKPKGGDTCYVSGEDGSSDND